MNVYYKIIRTFQKQKIEDKNNSDKLESNEGGKIEEQRKEEDTEKANETKAVKPGNPLLKMFEKMREKNVSRERERKREFSLKLLLSIKILP